MMIRGLRGTVLSIRAHYTNPIQRQRAVGLFYLLSISSLVWLLSMLFVVVPRVISRGGLDGSTAAALFFPPVSFLLNIYLVLSGRLNLAAMLLIVNLIPFSAFSIVNYGVDSVALLTLNVPIVVAGLLLSRRWILLVVAVVGISIFLLMMAEFGSLTLLSHSDFMIALFAFIMIAAFFLAFSGNVDRVVAHNLREIDQFQKIVGFPRKVNRDSEQRVLSGALAFIRNDLGYNFAQVFLIGEQGVIDRRLRAGMGARGEGNISAVTISDASALADAARTRQPVLVSSNDNPLRRGHFLPSTEFGAAIPVIVNDQVVGVFDVQHTSSEPFTDASIDALANLASAAAAVWSETQAMNALRDHLAEQEIAVANMREQLREFKQQEREVVGSAWESYLEGRGQEVVGFDMNIAAKAATPADDFPPVLRQAIANGALNVEMATDGHQVITVPIMLRGETLGAMAFTIPADRFLSEREIDIAISVADRLALALDNKRLYEQSQSQASREQKAGEIASLLIGATDVDTVLSLAADSFNEALGAVRTHIQLQPDILLARDTPTNSREA